MEVSLQVEEKEMDTRQAASVAPPTLNADLAFNIGQRTVDTMKHVVQPGNPCTDPGRDAAMPSVDVGQAQHKIPPAQRLPEGNRCAFAKKSGPWSQGCLAKQEDDVSSSSSDSDDERYDLAERYDVVDSGDERYDVVDSGDERYDVVQEDPAALGTDKNGQAAGMKRNDAAVTPSVQAGQLRNIRQAPHIYAENRGALANGPGPWSPEYLDKQREDVSTSSSDSDDERYDLVGL
ncbi:uncharacterized protein LOC106063267 [Biomphalaria glabrata]|uniref:Uncharacterized protein LOC106063267 n=1 Tax=Biomphalaria glabrata TaxID=6526 RepID=A0A9U8E7U0_BIOGL|nr:uncharacterized protein LOC106063267 [Biomphalaria glabrata]